MRILLAEYDQVMSSVVGDGLKQQYLVDCVTNAADTLSYAESTCYDLFLIDAELPDHSGLLVCQKLRHLGLQAPILMLVSNTQFADKVTLLDAGADDCLSKPFSFAELAARIRALSRRNAVMCDLNRLEVDDVMMNLASGEVFHRGIKILLRRKEYLVLEYLLRQAGRVITRDMLLEQVWEAESDPFTNTVDVHIKFLRDKLDKAFGSNHILTIHGVGYKFMPDQSEQ
jgi:DNA-binding response OmpR family regulator